MTQLEPLGRGYGRMLDVIPLIGKIIDRVIPDPEKQAEAKLKVLELQQRGDLEELKAELQRDVAQAEVNKVEAQSDSIFKSGWRPFIGWVCGAGFVYSVIIYPMLSWIATLNGIHELPPNLGVDILMPVMLGMLGLGGMRSFEKYKGVTK